MKLIARMKRPGKRPGPLLALSRIDEAGASYGLLYLVAQNAAQ